MQLRGAEAAEEGVQREQEAVGGGGTRGAKGAKACIIPPHLSQKAGFRHL